MALYSVTLEPGRGISVHGGSAPIECHIKNFGGRPRLSTLFLFLFSTFLFRPTAVVYRFDTEHRTYTTL